MGVMRIVQEWSVKIISIINIYSYEKGKKCNKEGCKEAGLGKEDDEKGF